jgi:uncharacterized protein YecE (DUF72 family)
VDSDGHVPLVDVTADFVYARLRRVEAGELEGYPAAVLDQWPGRFRAWAAGGVPADVKPIDPAAVAKQPRDCFVYFINGAKERAPAAAIGLIKRLNLLDNSSPRSSHRAAALSHDPSGKHPESTSSGAKGQARPKRPSRRA